MRDRRREEFPSLSRGIHLLSHSLGPMPRRAREAMSVYLDRWERYGSENAWEAEWWDLSRKAGDLLGQILGAPAGSVCIQPNASVAISSAASCLDFTGQRKKIVTTSLEFPTMEYILRERERSGARLEVIASEDGVTTPIDRLLEAIDEETVLVAISHASYRSSFLLDPGPIVQRAHEVGSFVLLDIYQTAGVLPLEVAAWGGDFAVGGTIKWLCGGPACGYLFVRPDLLSKLEPRLTGWIAHAEPFDFAPGRIRYDKGVRRFAQGTPSIPALYSSLPGIEILLEVGAETIALESRRRTQEMVDTAIDRGWDLKSPAEAKRRGGTVMLGTENPERLAGELSRRGVLVDWRPGVVRISPHFFNTDDEVAQTLEILGELLG
jgi:kynureninase